MSEPLLREAAWLSSVQAGQANEHRQHAGPCPEERLRMPAHRSTTR